ncbi:DNA-binding winged helix-turn-helix (wHTH) protein/tetratricopeptide (TPR) repeat protein [Rhodanobacter sp. K2T2]|uniref:winged helix-turn-helix domain-containing protein n=1 Tax=Rhodanobacter sp. K2T2 TaxID=2723085 RepID=UPI0015C9287D|nr:transcriptional regulator [Rhodanobacter sp. K2T2]NYE27085.1 DNA-binding winged helix-turn-helix (wHTH) protein/tetratricopeptide (TPR) repeat protein [Rhodanobacter sp. K2T2]
MKAQLYVFGDFSLDPLARELKRRDVFIALPASAFDCLAYLIKHRERPVGRDELISAVWGRTDVSENLLAQTIVRLRRELDDAGSKQSAIRTIVRVGYRWMIPTAVIPKSFDVAIASDFSNKVSPFDGSLDKDKVAARQPPKSSTKWRDLYTVRTRTKIALSTSLVVAVAIAVLVFLHRRYQDTAFLPVVATGTGLAVVLPAEVKAPNDWQWLQLGLMALISDRLNHAKMPTMASQIVVSQLDVKVGDIRKDAFSDERLGVSMRINPRVSLANGKWIVELDARTSAHETVRVHAVSDDALTAGNIAADLLLVRFGLKPLKNVDPPVAQQLLVQRIITARLSAQEDLAQRLIEQAPPSVKNLPVIRYYDSLLKMDAGDYGTAGRDLHALLEQLPVRPETEVLRGQIFESLGGHAQYEGEKEEALKFFDQAVPLLQGNGNEIYLGYAYAFRAQVEKSLQLFVQASDDVGRARVSYARAGDLQGAAIADYQTGLILTDRGQLEASMSFLKKSYEEFSRIGGNKAMLTVSIDIANDQRLLLHFGEVLKTTDSFWPTPSFVKIRPISFWLSLHRAQALADVGRVKEAQIMVNSILKESEATDKTLLALTQALQANIALVKGDYKTAFNAAAAAKMPALKDASDIPYAQTWLVLIRSLRGSGEIKQARIETRAMREWVATKTPDDWSEIYIELAEAEQIAAEGETELSLQKFATIMNRAQQLGVPELLVDVGQSYASKALAAGHIDQAMAISGTLAPWATTDMRAAMVQASVYQALGQSDAALAAHKLALSLAGERSLPTGN